MPDLSVVTAVKSDLAKLPPDLRRSGLAAAALTLAGLLDDPENSATSKSMCARSLREALRELRELAPPEEDKDGVDEIAERRTKRRAGGAATKG